MKRAFSAPVLIGALATLAAIGLVAIVVVQQLRSNDAQNAGLAMPDVKIGGPFSLIDSDGKAVTEADFKGKYRLMYFGYSFCPDVCPTDLQIVGNAMLDLEDMDPDGASKVVPMFISVDPKRDKPDMLKDFVANFHPRMVGLTGSEKQVAEVAKAFRVYYKLNEPDEDGNYLVDHSAFIYFMGPDGEYLTMFKHGEASKKVADTIENLISG
ncbi:SCO family protein [Aestuariispira ectoiniformans]|uniref:SCO family protein n=1 Tax=Aestuariispira ectoiniformans TaxID=2775080 RepID=UPI00223C27D7|nr:SCO family protein [Aestuariispira ectoiniformans]